MPGRETPCIPETLGSVTQLMRNLGERGGIQERSHEGGGTGDQPGMMDRISFGSRE